MNYDRLNKSYYESVTDLSYHQKGETEVLDLETS